MRQSPTNEDKEQALAFLRHWAPAGSTIYTVLRHTSRSGMQRVIDLLVIHIHQGSSGAKYLSYPLYLSYHANVALGWRYHERLQGVVANGSGTDMGWHLVEYLGQKLHGPEHAFKHYWI